jgi:hypothetical protein
MVGTKWTRSMLRLWTLGWLIESGKRYQAFDQQFGTRSFEVLEGLDPNGGTGYSQMGLRALLDWDSCDEGPFEIEACVAEGDEVFVELTPEFLTRLLGSLHKDARVMLARMFPGTPTVEDPWILRFRVKGEWVVSTVGIHKDGYPACSCRRWWAQMAPPDQRSPCLHVRAVIESGQWVSPGPGS